VNRLWVPINVFSHQSQKLCKIGDWNTETQWTGSAGFCRKQVEGERFAAVRCSGLRVTGKFTGWSQLNIEQQKTSVRVQLETVSSDAAIPV
jgi:hypothetical protein